MLKFPDIWSRWIPFKGEVKSDNADQAQTKPLLSPGAGKGLLALLLIGALLMLISKPSEEPSQPTAGSLRPDPPVTPTTPVHQEKSLEQQLRTILSQIAGVGSVDVYVTMDTGPEQVVAEEVNSQHTTNTTSQPAAATTDVRETRRPVTVRDDASRVERPLVLVQKEATVRGVVVVADGASSAAVRYRLSQAVEVALGVPAHRVAVFPRK